MLSMQFAYQGQLSPCAQMHVAEAQLAGDLRGTHQRNSIERLGKSLELLDVRFENGKNGSVAEESDSCDLA
jgi:hypothetical protein